MNVTNIDQDLVSFSLDNENQVLKLSKQIKLGQVLKKMDGTVEVQQEQIPTEYVLIIRIKKVWENHPAKGFLVCKCNHLGKNIPPSCDVTLTKMVMGWKGEHGDTTPMFVDFDLAGRPRFAEKRLVGSFTNENSRGELKKAGVLEDWVPEFIESMFIHGVNPLEDLRQLYPEKQWSHNGGCLASKTPKVWIDVYTNGGGIVCRTV